MFINDFHDFNQWLTLGVGLVLTKRSIKICWLKFNYGTLKPLFSGATHNRNFSAYIKDSYLKTSLEINF